MLKMGRFGLCVCLRGGGQSQLQDIVMRAAQAARTFRVRPLRRAASSSSLISKAAFCMSTGGRVRGRYRCFSFSTTFFMECLNSACLRMRLWHMPVSAATDHSPPWCATLVCMRDGVPDPQQPLTNRAVDFFGGFRA